MVKKILRNPTNNFKNLTAINPIATSKMNSDEFSLLPLNPADDVCEILRIHYQNYLSDAFYSSALESRQTEEDFINDRIESIINQHSKPGALGAKLVLEKHPERMVGYIV